MFMTQRERYMRLGLALMMLITMTTLVLVQSHPTVAQAQAGIALTRTQKLPGIDYQISYPDHWHVKSSSTAISISQATSDFEQALENETGYVRAGIEVSFNLRPISYPPPSLDDLATAITYLFACDGGCEPTRIQQFDVPAMRFHITDAYENAVLMTVGVLDGQSFVLAVTAPSEPALDTFMPTWEAMSASIVPFETRQLDITDFGYSIDYPDNWFAVEGQAFTIFAERQDDIDTILEVGRVDAVNGHVIMIEYLPRTDLEDFGLASDASVEELVSLNAKFFGITLETLDAEPTPIIAFSVRSIELLYTSGNSSKATVMGLTHDDAFIITLTSPSRESRDAFLPTWTLMLESSKPTVPASKL